MSNSDLSISRPIAMSLWATFEFYAYLTWLGSSKLVTKMSHIIVNEMALGWQTGSTYQLGTERQTWKDKELCKDLKKG